MCSTSGCAATASTTARLPFAQIALLTQKERCSAPNEVSVSRTFACEASAVAVSFS
jgi:hypothetical protein